MIFPFEILGDRVGLYELEFKGPVTDPQNRFWKYSDPHSTRLGIRIHPWVFRSDGWVESGGLMDSPIVDTWHNKISF